MGFNMLFYIIFGTNLLTGGLVPVSVFLCLFWSFAEKEYQTESNRNETFMMIFLGPEENQETWIWSRRRNKAATRQEGAHLPRGPLVAPLT